MPLIIFVFIYFILFFIGALALVVVLSDGWSKLWFYFDSVLLMLGCGGNHLALCSFVDAKPFMCSLPIAETFFNP